MKKKVILLAGFCLAIGLCFGGWWLLREDAAADAAGDALWELTGIGAITVTDDEGAVIPLEKTADGWVFGSDTAFPLDQSYPEAMVTALTAPALGRMLTEGIDLAGWGLDAPWATVTVTAGDRTETLRFGDLNPVTNQYYVTVEGREGAVYMLASDLGSPFTYSLQAMAALPDPFGTLDSTSIYDIRVESDAGTVHVWNDSTAGWVVRCEEQGVAQTACDAAVPEEITSDAGYLYYSELVSWHGEAELAAYGLDKPDKILQFKGWSIDSPDIAMTVRLHLKQMPDSDNWYAWEEGSDYICTLYNYLVNRASTAAADYLPAA